MTETKTTNPANRVIREDLQCSYDASIEHEDKHHVIPNEHCNGWGIGDAALYDKSMQACLAAFNLLANGEASELTVVLHADEVHEVLNLLGSVLGKRG